MTLNGSRLTCTFDMNELHAGGRGVIEGLGKQLELSNTLLEPSFASLYWYGNTSSASVWYALSFIETARSLARGDIVWQVTFANAFLYAAA